jgi:hypothetical protein
MISAQKEGDPDRVLKNAMEGPDWLPADQMEGPDWLLADHCKQYSH